MKELYISDLDGTLLDNNKKITPYSIEVINDFIEKGGIFSIATARTAATAVEMVKHLKINCPIVLMNGAMIFDIHSNSYIKFEEICIDALIEVCDLIKKYNLGGFLYTFNGEKILAYYEELSADVMDFYNQRKENNPYKTFVKTSSLKEHIGESCVYFALMDYKDKLLQVYNELNNKNIEKTMYMDVYNKEIYYLEIFSDKATKSKAVQYIKENLKLDRVTAFGDNLNDIDMLKAADYAVVPENAIAKAKEFANEICRSNTEDGVARFIRANTNLHLKHL